MPPTAAANGIEFGSGVFGITVTVGAVQKTIAYLTVKPAVSAQIPGEEIWYVVDDTNNNNAHRAWVDHVPSAAHDPKALRFDWIQSDIDDFVANVLPTGAGNPTYKMHVHTTAFAVAYP